MSEVGARPSTGGSAIRVASAGHVAFAATMILFGFLGLRHRDFTALWEPVPEDVPARVVLAYLCALVSLVGGLGLLWRRAAAPSSRLLVAWFLLWLLVLRLPRVLVAFAVDTWWPVCQTAAMLGAAWVLFTWFADQRDRRRFDFATDARGLRVARALFGFALIPFGLAHFLYLEATAPLVPAWLPGHVFWAYFTGATFIAAGVAIVAGVWARLAAALSAVQMGLFTVLIWVPMVAAGAASESQRGEFVVSCALTAAGWVVADSYRGVSASAARRSAA
jgi:uncharacterized membrane protein